ncbi:hypothetical protein ACIQD3_08880 [Peribacillus loiseleuriae]|uniref:hypothetical protein n=1 Tax=Peribacillus loiseleuriae TaxID=1679170 RepID=UPI0037FD082C
MLVGMDLNQKLLKYLKRKIETGGPGIVCTVAVNSTEHEVLHFAQPKFQIGR